MSLKHQTRENNIILVPDDTKIKSLEQIMLNRIINNSYDGIFVTDRFGNVLLVNPAAVRILQKTSEEIIGANVKTLVKEGVYNRSTTLEAIQKRTTVTGLIKMFSGKVVLSTSIPLIDERGEIILCITNTRDKDLIETYVAALEQEQNKADRYKSAAKYLVEFDSENKLPIAESSLMRQIISQVNIIAKSNSTVLILGESGTGKEVIAKHIHRISPRFKEPFIPVNCAAIPYDLMESEFFGYERGAFSGASSYGKPGFFELADKGTLFLDEIADLPIYMQAKLLRVLETGEVQRLGGTSVRQTHVRLVAATNRDLKSMVYEKLFRNDLYYRLDVISITLPPLRDRPDDIIALSQKFLDEFNKKYGYKKIFSEKTIKDFLQYAWPGNVRELRNVIERLVIISPDNELKFGDESIEVKKEVPKEVVAFQETKPSQFQYRGSDLKSVLKSVEEQYINQVIQECNGRLGESAQRLGIHRSMLYRKIIKMRQEKHVEQTKH